MFQSNIATNDVITLYSSDDSCVDIELIEYENSKDFFANIDPTLLGYEVIQLTNFINADIVGYCSGDLFDSVKLYYHLRRFSEGVFHLNKINNFVAVEDFHKIPFSVANIQLSFLFEDLLLDYFKGNIAIRTLIKEVGISGLTSQEMKGFSVGLVLNDFGLPMLNMDEKKNNLFSYIEKLHEYKIQKGI